MQWSREGHLQVYLQSHLQVYLPKSDIWWPIAVLFQMKCTAQVYPKFSDGSVHAVVNSRAPSDDVYRSRVTFKFIGRVTFKFTPCQVTSGGQDQYYFQMKCTAQVYPKFYPPLVTSGDQEQHKARSWWHWLRVMMTLSFTPLLQLTIDLWNNTTPNLWVILTLSFTPIQSTIDPWNTTTPNKFHIQKNANWIFGSWWY